ncbi:MAG: hypothetical protein ACPLSP_06180 [Fervidicoccus fontis]
MTRVFTYICGDGGPYDEFNPFKVTRQNYVPEILFLLNQEPLSENELSSKLAIDIKLVNKLLSDLFRINAVVKRSGRWHISFPVFNKKDIHLIAERTKKHALELADEIMKKESEIKRNLAQLSCAKQVEMNKIMFAVIGCFILDWKGLEVLNEKDLTLCSRKQQPGGRRYVLLGREEGIDNSLYDKMYWGSHSDRFGKIVFTSFGDHTGYRYAFPDLVWNITTLISYQKEEGEHSNWFKTKIKEAFSILQINSVVELGRILLLLNNDGPIDVSQLSEKLNKEKGQCEELLKFLADMKYVSLAEEKAKLSCPVFTVRDKASIEAIWKILSKPVEMVACTCFDSLRTKLVEITPIQRGIDPREIYTDVWHWIFGGANKIMAERGFLFDPPKEREGEGRYISWIEEVG